MKKRLVAIGVFMLFFLCFEIIFIYLLAGYFSPSDKINDLILTSLFLSITTHLLFTPPEKF